MQITNKSLPEQTARLLEIPDARAEIGVIVAGLRVQQALQAKLTA